MTERPARLRNTSAVEELACENYTQAVQRQLMRVTLEGRSRRKVAFGGKTVTEWVNCSYLGIDTRPEVIARGQALIAEWGVHLCCARSRFSIGPLEELEDGLSQLWGAHAVTFPSVTSAHMSTMPLLPSRELSTLKGSVTFLYDRFAHASMQFLKPVLAAEHRVESVPHNDVDALERAAKEAHQRGDSVIYVADGVYSMGGVCPIDDVLALSQRVELALYIDDAHGTSIFGERGEGSVLSRLGERRPENLTLTFSLSKGFGTNGGGVLLPSREAERRVRTYGMTYAFSGPLDFAIVGSALASLELHRTPELQRLQAELRRKVALFDALTGTEAPFSPIRMVKLGDEQRAIAVAEQLRDKGHFTSVTFFPIVARGDAMLRLCLGVDHSDEDIAALVRSLREVGALG
ncbi:MAG: aminotransferase class I/II-fold pyridoxal phosphate-dependent enzyme [Archangiaceae bacterium]|nr:aminotransferase class I/II-fold pyridoxal phosphate-dependent enzyme [Archangiaceae bacterium]